MFYFNSELLAAYIHRSSLANVAILVRHVLRSLPIDSLPPIAPFRVVQALSSNNGSLRRISSDDSARATMVCTS